MLGRLFKCHADGESFHRSPMFVASYRKMLPVNSRLQSTVDGFQKIVAMVRNMKADQIRPKQTLHNLR